MATEIKFRQDTSFRKALFSPNSFAHPAKMDAQLLLWIVERYTKPSETILDPMAGSGTAMIGCTIGRNIVQVELEQKFVDMQKANWEKVKMMPQLGHEIGECHIIQGDARQLGDILAGHAIFSPPFKEQMQDTEWMRANQPRKHRGTHDPNSQCPENIGSLPYGVIDPIVTSPPYAERHSYPDVERERFAVEKLKAHPDSKIGGVRIHEHESDNPNSIGNLPYGSIDSVITSPPYEEGGQGVGTELHPERMAGTLTGLGRGYSDNTDNIGNLKADSYLAAMLQVYQQCHKVLKPGGLMIVVTKNFIRNKKEIRLDEDTIRLCEQAGFEFVERHYRKLPAQSFWRVIYQQKYPDAPVLDKEDILVFKKVAIPQEAR